MSFYDGYTFFAFLLIFVVIAIILGIREKSMKFYLFAVSWFFIFATISSASQLLWMLIFIAMQLYTVKIYVWLRKKYGRVEWIYYHAIFFAILPLILNKLIHFLPFRSFLIIGISYVTFRTVQIIIELYDGVMEDVNTFETLTFLIFFPSLSSGPIDRSRRFSEDFNCVRKRADYLELAGKGLEKILLGAVYKFVISALVYNLVTRFSPDLNLAHNAFYAYSYGVYMFFDFAGYSLMAIGTGYCFGILVPENFNKPFLSLDIKEFWDRWHISLSHWFRDFIFSRFMMRAIRGKWFKKRLNGASVGFIVNMLVMGLWHGVCLEYILYGLYHGILLAITERYQKKSKFYKAHKNQLWFKSVSWFITINLVMFGFYIFSGRFTAYLSLLLVSL